jgi:hypothetical protein
LQTSARYRYNSELIVIAPAGRILARRRPKCQAVHDPDAEETNGHLP